MLYFIKQRLKPTLGLIFCRLDLGGVGGGGITNAATSMHLSVCAIVCPT